MCASVARAVWTTLRDILILRNVEKYTDTNEKKNLLKDCVQWREQVGTWIELEATP